MIDEIEGHGITPIPRRGGKSKLAKRLIAMMPTDYDIFCEPFVGAGNIIFRKPEHGIEIINDKDKHIYTVLKAVQNKPDYLNKHTAEKLPLTKDEYEKLLNKNDAVSIIRVSRQSYMGLIGNYASISGRIYHTTYNVMSDRLKHVKIYNKDFSWIIKKFDSTGTFFYLDPPYENIDERDYTHYISPEDVYEHIKNIKGRFMLSYNNSTNIRNIFKEFRIKKISTTYKLLGGNKPVVELVIMNY
jgi:DNA adenine methylase